ncbi:MAG: glycine--tRNA ligase subunit alpha [Acidobacteria bacterium]|nr:glycine--tRNA ligase subunit alpha [Thermoanaerobaculia bacterium]NLN11974.1 glycine--tRNA ligase subunit alpha [Acidobacteriota bacterium]MBP7812088.1 glycine--tRNA ligase subunit alpha [Thermoanaerobaculia bacterium]HRR13731.1 glycine--tRNA ligase subunit alpha [Thermoanaerobaculia bacterium]HRS37252.1 glycine--tRNA ligase subunit alpha [Thermoanaerobaculia bacterium]
MRSFQELILALSRFWADAGCVLQQPLDLEVGAGTMAPDTFLRVLGPEPWRVAYVQPSRRPADGRYGDNPFRLHKHYQFQVILKPAPADVQQLYVRSLEAMGIDLAVHDLRFEEDNWEAPTLGAWGVGWQVMLDGMEITQFTYFQQAGGIDLAPISCEITYGLERITMFLGLERSIYDIRWVPGGPTYRQVRHQEEVEASRYAFEVADIALLQQQFEGWEREARRCLEAALVLPAYECALKCSHLFNLLDARGAVSVTERVGLMKRVRDLAVACAAEYLASRERLGFPLLAAGEVHDGER